MGKVWVKRWVTIIGGRTNGATTGLQLPEVGPSEPRTWHCRPCGHLPQRSASLAAGFGEHQAGNLMRTRGKGRGLGTTRSPVEEEPGGWYCLAPASPYMGSRSTTDYYHHCGRQAPQDQQRGLWVPSVGGSEMCNAAFWCLEYISACVNQRRSSLQRKCQQHIALGYLIWVWIPNVGVFETRSTFFWPLGRRKRKRNAPQISKK